MNTEIKRLSSHITHASGRRKTVCTSSVLAYFGIAPSEYKYSQCIRDINRVLRSKGFAVRSRLSTVVTKKFKTVGAIRERVKALNVPSGAFYIGVDRHVLVMDREGNTVVDTAPRKRDKRQVLEIYWVSKSL